jgi:hypothetical protein
MGGKKTRPATIIASSNSRPDRALNEGRNNELAISTLSLRGSTQDKYQDRQVSHDFPRHGSEIGHAGGVPQIARAKFRTKALALTKYSKMPWKNV